jgi:hypothetical protein
MIKKIKFETEKNKQKINKAITLLFHATARFLCEIKKKLKETNCFLSFLHALIFYFLT